MIQNLVSLVNDNRYVRRISLMLLDLLIITFSIIQSFRIKYGSLQSIQSIITTSDEWFIFIFLVCIILNLIWFYSLRSYHVVWETFGVNEAARLFIANAVSALSSYIIMKFTVFTGKYLSPDIFLLTWGLAFAMTCSVRFLNRAFIRWIKQRNNIAHASVVSRAMIIGAGFSGLWFAEMLIKNGYKNGDNCLIPIVFIDDDLQKRGTRPYGIPVVGGRDSIIEKAAEYEIDQIIFAIPSASATVKKEILDICKQANCKTMSLPSLEEIVRGNVRLDKLQNVNISDLLGRNCVELDMCAIRANIEDQVVLVTGGGGSIGSELCRVIAGYNPKKLIILDIYENTTYELQLELKTKYGNRLDLDVVIGTVKEKAHLSEIFEEFKPDIVFHAAAHKHVPLMESSPIEAVKNNIFGTFNVAECAHRYGAKKFVLISTDKAVNPTNIMGATKRVAELIVQYLSSKSQTKFTAVRFGNVLGSNGSVIPIFNRQIANGGPVTITHKDVTRYFMTINEAVQLVLQASAMAEGGEIFILEMGEPVKISDMAMDLIRLSGHEPDVDIKIVYTGLRPGEKMYEELLLPSEGVQKTIHKKIMVSRSNKKDFENIESALEQLSAIVETRDNDQVRRMLATLAGYGQICKQ